MWHILSFIEDLGLDLGIGRKNLLQNPSWFCKASVNLNEFMLLQVLKIDWFDEILVLVLKLQLNCVASVADPRNRHRLISAVTWSNAFLWNSVESPRKDKRWMDLAVLNFEQCFWMVELQTPACFALMYGIYQPEQSSGAWSTCSCAPKLSKECLPTWLQGYCEGPPALSICPFLDLSYLWEKNILLPFCLVMPH